MLNDHREPVRTLPLFPPDPSKKTLGSSAKPSESETVSVGSSYFLNREPILHFQSL